MQLQKLKRKRNQKKRLRSSAVGRAESRGSGHRRVALQKTAKTTTSALVTQEHCEHCGRSRARIATAAANEQLKTKQTKLEKKKSLNWIRCSERYRFDSMHAKRHDRVNCLRHRELTFEADHDAAAADCEHEPQREKRRTNRRTIEQAEDIQQRENPADTHRSNEDQTGRHTEKKQTYTSRCRAPVICCMKSLAGPPSCRPSNCSNASGPAASSSASDCSPFCEITRKS